MGLECVNSVRDPERKYNRNCTYHAMFLLACKNCGKIVPYCSNCKEEQISISSMEGGLFCCGIGWKEYSFQQMILLEIPTDSEKLAQNEIALRQAQKFIDERLAEIKEQEKKNLEWIRT